MDFPPGDVSELVGLLRRHHNETGRMNRVFAERHGLHHTDWAALLAIARNDAADDPLTPGDLGDRLGMSSGATTALVDRLERGGYVRRARHGRDRRRVTLHRDDRAAALLAAFFHPLEGAMDAVVSHYSEAELAAVRRFLTECIGGIVEFRRRWAQE